MTPRTLSANVLAALEGVRFIAQHIRDADKDNEVSAVFCLRVLRSVHSCLIRSCVPACMQDALGLYLYGLCIMTRE